MGNSACKIDLAKLSNITYDLIFNSVHLRRIRFLFPFKMLQLTETEVESLRNRLDKAEKYMGRLQTEIQYIKKILNRDSYGSGLSTVVGQKRSISSLGTSEIDNPEEAFVSNAKKSCMSMEDDYVVVYTDGACEGNGRTDAKAGIGVWFGANHPLNVSEPVKGRPTNNTAEIQACIEAVKIANINGIKKLKIKTDSQFVINSMTSWIFRWKKNNWKLATGGDVKNKTDFVELDKMLALLDAVKWEYVAGHKGITGNEEADKLARAGAARYKPT